MKQISLTQGKMALVDDEDYEYLNQWKWYAHCRKNSNIFYACRWDKSRKEHPRKIIRMHRFILQPTKNLQVDHIDGNGLNNQRSNLRLCTGQQNSQNCRLARHNTSGYKGVTFDRTGYRARITFNRKQILLGYFSTPEEAAQAYNKAAIKYFGRFAKLNIMKGNI